MSYEINNGQIFHFKPDAHVTDFLSASLNDDPLLYPGQRPESSYVTDGQDVYFLKADNRGGVLHFSMNSDKGEIDINIYLGQAAAPLLEERIPVLAFGANMSPGSLASKFKKVGRPDALIIPTVYATLADHDVVWSGAPGINGNFIAILYKGEETKGAQVQTGVNFLTREQLIVMHATELNYELSSVNVDIDGIKTKAYYYAGRDSVYLQDGKPVAIESVLCEGRSLPEASTADLLDSLLADSAVRDELLASHPGLEKQDSAGYIEYVTSLKARIGARTELKKFMHDLVIKHRLAKYADNADAIKGLQSWANPSVIPTYGEQLAGVQHHDTLRLASQELGDWPDPEARRKVLKAIATHHHRHQDNQRT